MVFMEHVCEGGEHGTGAKFDGFVEGEKAIKKKKVKESVGRSGSRLPFLVEKRQRFPC